MALFSLLVAVIIERLKLLPQKWQLETLLKFYTQSFYGDNPPNDGIIMLVVLSLPALCLLLLEWLASGLLGGVVDLTLWLVVAILCFSHLKQRQLFSQYIHAACRGDVQASFRFADELDPNRPIAVDSTKDLGAAVGQTVAWINYRFYSAVALYLMFLGPAGAVYYCTVRYFSDEAKSRQTPIIWLDQLLMLLDWLPSRLIALGYVLSGHFSPAFHCWLQQVFQWQCPPREIIVKVAMVASAPTETSPDPVCIRATVSLLQLSKRNFTFLLIGLSLLTLFGVVG